MKRPYLMIRRVGFAVLIPVLLMAFAVYHGRLAGFIGWMIIAAIVGTRLDHCLRTGERFFVDSIRREGVWRLGLVRATFEQVFYRSRRRKFMNPRVACELGGKYFIVSPVILVLTLSHLYLGIVAIGDAISPENARNILIAMNEPFQGILANWAAWQRWAAKLVEHGYSTRVPIFSHALIVEVVGVAFCIAYSTIYRGRELRILLNACIRRKFPEHGKRIRHMLVHSVLIPVVLGPALWLFWLSGFLVIDFGLYDRIPSHSFKSSIISTPPDDNFGLFFPVTFMLNLGLIISGVVPWFQVTALNLNRAFARKVVNKNESVNMSHGGRPDE